MSTVVRNGRLDILTKLALPSVFSAGSCYKDLYSCLGMSHGAVFRIPNFDVAPYLQNKINVILNHELK